MVRFNVFYNPGLYSGFLVRRKGSDIELAEFSYKDSVIDDFEELSKFEKRTGLELDVSCDTLIYRDPLGEIKYDSIRVYDTSEYMSTDMVMHTSEMLFSVRKAAELNPELFV